MVILCLAFWGTAKLFSIVAELFLHSYQQSMKVPVPPHPSCQHLIFFLIFVFDSSHPSRCEVVSLWFKKKTFFIVVKNMHNIKFTTVNSLPFDIQTGHSTNISWDPPHEGSVESTAYTVMSRTGRSPEETGVTERPPLSSGSDFSRKYRRYSYCSKVDCHNFLISVWVCVCICMCVVPFM